MKRRRKLERRRRNERQQFVIVRSKRAHAAQPPRQQHAGRLFILPCTPERVSARSVALRRGAEARYLYRGTATRKAAEPTREMAKGGCARGRTNRATGREGERRKVSSRMSKPQLRSTEMINASQQPFDRSPARSSTYLLYSLRSYIPFCWTRQNTFSALENVWRKFEGDVGQ